MISLLFISTIIGYIFSWLLYKRQQKYSQQIKRKIEHICARKIANKRNISATKTESLASEYQHLKKIIVQKYEQNIQSLEEQITYQEVEVQNREEYLSLKEQLFFEKKARVQTNVDCYKNLYEKLEDIRREHKNKLLQTNDYDVATVKEDILNKVDKELRGEKELLLNRFADDITISSEEIAKRLLSSIVQRSVFGHWHDSYPNSVWLEKDEVLRFIESHQHTFTDKLGVTFHFKNNNVVINDSDGYCREIMRKLLLDIVEYDIQKIDDLDIEKKQQQYKQKTIHFVQQKCTELGMKHLPETLAWSMGKLRYRTSFGQNVLAHSFEVAMLSWRIAGELGLSQFLCQRGGFLHDIGKAVDHQESGGHSSLGEQMLRDENETNEVIEGVVEHHEDVSAQKPFAAVVNISDAISAARPGARRETFEKYMKKLQKIESLTKDIQGIEDAYAVSAGREIRVVVNSEIINDKDAEQIAKQLADSVGKEILYSGVVRVTVIREKTIEVYT
ncbi:HDIG domain-containing metalloprotein [Candidatus Uabimicrobium amorphum]|uniref:Ribonuclease Y n=1 Tax=Uabimicrobium amorphum TaxID=2596890 RepID=A0A5S9IH73_UABAM|nr:HDIG domain-containing metalloprotein [Candidatus Uabimicrobium amorphum]BBM81738.1 ribonuclease Y [Candidatus Uabimicrobium amorphum]